MYYTIFTWHFTTRSFSSHYSFNIAILKVCFRDPWSQNYVHNNIYILFAFLTHLLMSVEWSFLKFIRCAVWCCHHWWLLECGPMLPFVFKNMFKFEIQYILKAIQPTNTKIFWGSSIILKHPDEESWNQTHWEH